MSIYQQKYKNNVRTISGLVNTPYQDDSVLLCDTSLGAVAITLLGIPSGDWSTQYKLYILDKSNNASVNNITINAPVGFLINGSGSFVITNNNASLIVRVASDTNYVGQYSVVSGGGGVAGHVIQEESVDLPQRLRLNFVGAGVTASDDLPNNATVVTIDGVNIISLTNLQLKALITAGTVIRGQFYRVTDCTYAPLGVIVQGVRGNAVSLQGTGIFYNADYDTIGDYSGVVGFGMAKGQWTTAIQPVVVGDCVVYDNMNYVNLTGAWGTAPSGDAVNWLVLAYSNTQGYIIEADFVKYDVNLNQVTYRADKRNNEVDLYIKAFKNSLTAFQWGRKNVVSNKVWGQSVMYCTNSMAIFVGNTLIDGELDDYATLGTGNINNNVILSSGVMALGDTQGRVSNNYVMGLSSVFRAVANTTVFANNSIVCNNEIIEASVFVVDTLNATADIERNYVTGASSVTLGVVDGRFYWNRISNKAVFITTQILVAGEVENCDIADHLVNIPTVSTVYSKKTCIKHFSDFVAIIDLNNPAIYGAGVLTLPALEKDYCGIWLCQNATGKNITQIVNLPSNYESIFAPENTIIPNTLQFIFTAVGVAIGNDIIANHSVANLGATLLNAYLSISDTMTFLKRGNLNLAITKNVWQ